MERLLLWRAFASDYGLFFEFISGLLGLSFWGRRATEEQGYYGEI
jgi:hypothetical protein